MACHPVRCARLTLGMILAVSLIGPAPLSAGDVPMPTGIECVRDCQGATSSSKSHHSSFNSDVNALVVGAVFGAILGAALAPEPEPDQKELQAQQAAAAAKALAEQQARAAEAQAAYDRMMQSYKPLNNAADTEFKSISNTSVGFKSLDSEMEAMAANARAPFDTAGADTQPPPPVTGSPTAFFGDTMPMDQVRLLVEPDKDPRVADLRKAKTFVVDSLKQPVDQSDQSAPGEPAWTGPDKAECQAMQVKLNGFVRQQTKFHQTVLLANDQVDVWEEANRNALINAAKEGIEFFAGKYMDMMSRRGEAADRLTRMLDRKRKDMLAAGVDVGEVERKIARLASTSKRGTLAGVISDANDWQTFVKDGMSAVLNQLNQSNAEIFEDPVMQRYFTTEAPELQSLLDISQIAGAAGVFGKAVTKAMPIVGWTVFATNQAYNATEWFVSFQNLAEAHQINGQVADAVQSLQRKIDDTRIAFKQCS